MAVKLYDVQINKERAQIHLWTYKGGKKKIQIETLQRGCRKNINLHLTHIRQHTHASR